MQDLAILPKFGHEPDMHVRSIHALSDETPLPLPFVEAAVAAGFPSPAESYLDRKIDLNTELIQHPSSTFFVRVSGDSMLGAGIHNGDTLIVDRALAAKHDDIIVALWNNEFTVKRLWQRGGNVKLLAENPNYPPLVPHAEEHFEIWGVVTYVIHALR